MTAILHLFAILFAAALGFAALSGITDDMLLYALVPVAVVVDLYRDLRDALSIHDEH